MNCIGFSASYSKYLEKLRSRRPYSQPTDDSNELSFQSSPSFLSFYFKAAVTISKIEGILSNVRQLDRRIVTPSFDSTEKATLRIQKLLREANSLLKETQGEVRDAKPVQHPLMARIVAGAKAQTCSTLLRLGEAIRVAEERLSLSINALKKSSSPFDILTDASESASKRLFDDEGQEVLVLEIESSKLVRPEVAMLQGASKLSKVLQEISIMCVAQGTVVDRIDENIRRAHHHALEAQKQLSEAKTELQSGLAARCTRLLLLLNALVFGLLVIKFWFKSHV